MLYGVILLMLAGFVLPQEVTGSLRLVVNLPAYRLDAYANDSLITSYGVAIGNRSFPTPRGHFLVTSIEWNPWWIPPESKWAAREKVTPPGPSNPMGRVKLTFRDLYYIHGTPFGSSIGTAASHGCIRMRNDDAISLARIVHRWGSPSMPATTVEELATATSTRAIRLDVPIPLEVRYQLVDVRHGRVTVYRDVYSLATRSWHDQVYGALAAQGIDTLRLDRARIRSLTTRIPGAGRSIALDSLSR